MGIQLNKLQVRQARYDSQKHIDRNHWTTQLAIKPEVFIEAERYIFSSKTSSLDLSGGNILESLYGQAKTEYIDDLEWSWKMKVHTERGFTIIENRTNGDKTPGKYRAKFQVLVDEDFAAIGESWFPGSSDKSQVVTIVDKVKEGRGYLYTMQTYTEGSDHYINPKYLEPGTMWTRLYAMRGEAAESGGHIEKGSHIEFKNRLVKLRKQYTVTDYGAQAVLEIAFRDKEGKPQYSWMDMQEAEYIKALNKEASLLAMYSRIGDAPIYDPDSGYPISPGAGIQQQIEFGGNVERYTTMSAELIEAFIERIVYSRINPGDLGEVVGYSGYYGMKMFSKALSKLAGDQSIVKESNMFFGKDAKGVHNNSLSVGYQYTLYNLPNGGSFRLIHNPLYDDRSIHRDVDELTGVPLESQRITILDITGGNGESISKNNIKLFRKRNNAARMVVEGFVGPGGKPNSKGSHPGDYYTVHMKDSIGVQVTDPTITGELIKTVSK